MDGWVELAMSDDANTVANLNKCGGFRDKDLIEPSNS